MASRQEEKERRRAEREQQQAAARRAADRRRRLQLVFGGVLGVLLVAGVAAAAIGLAGGSDGSAASKPATDGSLPRLPAQRTSDLATAAKAAGCVVQNPPYEGAGHSSRNFKPSDYKTNPPTSGAHNPVYYHDGIYAPGDVPKLGELVHPLEHGRIEVQYRPGTSTAVTRQLEAFLAEQSDGYHMLMFQNTTGMRYAVAATAWTHLLGCPQMNSRVFDALRAFRARYVDKGPETVP